MNDSYDLDLGEGLINVRDSAELSHWCRELNCTEGLLRDAVDRVGATIHDVRRHLGCGRHAE